jgi:DNA-binding response OmpR family regulator
LADKILLIEDESTIAESISYALQNEGFEVTVVEDGLSGLAAARGAFPDLIILDLMLPKLGGFDLCRIIRRESCVPIIMLTARTEEVDKIVGLEMGADDYVTKPFSIRELIARIRAVLRRSERTSEEDVDDTLAAADVSIDLPRRRVTIKDKVIHLPLKQFELLKTLIAHRDKVLTREFLFQTVWENAAGCDSGTLDVHIRWLREKIEEDPSHPQYIRTIRGVGYKFVAEIPINKN